MGKSHKDIIKQSRKRSRDFGNQKEVDVKRKVLSPDDLKKVLKKNEELLEITIPVIEELHQFLRGTGFIVMLTDRNGCILEISGDSETLEEVRKQSMVRGAYMDEKSIGTTSSAPIHDLSGSIIGALSLTGSNTPAHPHTLGMVVAAVSAIEYRFNNLNIQKQLDNSNQFAFAMMNNLSYGLFAMDLNDDILWVNDTACRSINIRRLHLINIPIESIFPGWRSVKEAILSHDTYLDVEGRFNIPRHNEKYLFSAYLIKPKEGEILGYLLAFREYSGILKIINQYAGNTTRYTFDDLTGESRALKDLIRYCKTIARNPSTVLITGETGTGKEIIAQSIHHASPRHDAAFVAINCGAISESLIESELFGYVEGAFTGARKGGRPGKFELADKGTLFLDEIGEMPYDMQVKLLRTIQEKAVTRVGSDTPIPVNVRIIAATNRNLDEEVKAGRFRLDLYYRIHVIEVKVPPLRERHEDIVPLVQYFLKTKAAKYDIPIPEIKPGLMQRFEQYNWPGNIRELENLMEKAVILNGKLSEHDLIRNHTGETDNSETKTALPVLEQITWNLDEIEKATINQALAHFNRNISKTATALGVSRNTLYLKMKKFGIQL